MTTIAMTFQQRLGLSNFLAQSQGTLGKLVSLQRIFDQVSFSSEELNQIKQVPAGNGMTRYETPEESFATKEVQIETSDGEVLLQEISSRQSLTLPDLVWVKPLKSALEASKQ